MRHDAGRWLRHLGFGAIGLVIGAIVALNVLIYGGAERGYETSISEVARSQPLLAVVALSIVLIAPLVAVFLSGRGR